jgi:hypothetical protein
MKSFRDDTRGAVMFIGVFFACFLIGSLWFLIGIGDAIVFREKAQEAADASVFASAVIHAKGMNMIAFINATLLVLVGIYLILCLVVDVLLFLSAAAAATIIGLFGPAEVLFLKAEVVDKWALMYKTALKPVTLGLTTVQTATGYLAPWVGAAVGAKAGNEYSMASIVLSPSLLPGSAVGGTLGLAASAIGKLKGATSAGDSSSLPKNIAGEFSKKLGLPVVEHNLQDQCETVFGYLKDKIVEWIGAPRWVGGAIGFITGGLGSAMKFLHCATNDDTASLPSIPLNAPGGVPRFLRSAVNRVFSALRTLFASFMFFSVYKQDDLWGSKGDRKYGGPKKMLEPATNGSDWMQLYSMTFASQSDPSFKNVRRAQYVFNGSAPVQLPEIYKAQAEFYFDCSKKWKEDDCNGDGKIYDRSMYSMRWRARIVRYTGFSATNLGGDWLTSVLSSSTVMNAVKGYAKDKIGAGLSSVLGDYAKEALIGKGALGNKSALETGLKAGAKKLRKVINTTQLPESYH